MKGKQQTNIIVLTHPNPTVMNCLPKTLEPDVFITSIANYSTVPGYNLTVKLATIIKQKDNLPNHYKLFLFSSLVRNQLRHVISTLNIVSFLNDINVAFLQETSPILEYNDKM